MAVNGPDGGMQEQARQAFEERVENLDADTVRRLRLMRREAVGATAPSATRRLLPAAAFATALLLLGLGWRAGRIPAEPAPAPVAEAPLGVDLAADENAELYAWLGEAPVAAGDERL